jgi:hypothetical protein
MNLIEVLKECSKILTSYAVIKKANTKKSQTASLRKLDKKVENLGKSLSRQFLINIIIATVFFILGLLAPTLLPYFSNLL